MQHKQYLFPILVLLCHFFAPAVAAKQTIIIPPLSNNDSRYLYSQTLLLKALEHTAPDTHSDKLEPYPMDISRERLFKLLQEGKVHVAAEAPKPNWEQELIAIRIPLRKGIQGYRLFLIHEDIESDIAKVRNLKDLTQWSTGSGFQWSTQRILEENNFNVVTGKSYEGLFSMLNARRFETFGRGVNEIFAEYDSFKHKMPAVIIESRIALYIPLPTYFFVSPQYPALAERIKAGLLTMIENGEFDDLFYQFHGDMINQAKLEQRKIFMLNNPNLSAESVGILDRPAYWYRP